MRRKSFVLFMAMVLVVSFGSVGISAPMKAKLGHVGAPDHIFEVGAQKFAELVKEKTDGAVEIETYPGGQLGGDRDMMESLQMGTLEFAIEGPIDSFVPMASIIPLPYMWESPEHVYAFLDGPVSDKVYEGLDKMGIVRLANMENGWRLVTSSKKIDEMSDLEGFKIRTPESPMFRDTFIAFGAKPVPIPFPELYSALQQGVVEGQENPIFHIMTQKFYEVQDFLAMTRHIYLDAPLLVSKVFWGKLSEEQQEAVREAAMEATHYQRNVTMEREAALLEEIEKEHGVTITEPDLAPFKEAVKPLHQAWAEEFGEEYYQQIADLAK
jgi:tripartite ATP-independent transporter DctP family solute receptor